MNWKCDDRGDLLELFKIPNQGQVFLVNILPNKTRGNHYHTRKIEHFVVVAGTATVNLRNIEQEGFAARAELLDGQFPRTIEINPKTVHNIVAGHDGCLLLVWCNEHFDEKDPDTYFEEV